MKNATKPQAKHNAIVPITVLLVMLDRTTRTITGNVNNTSSALKEFLFKVGANVGAPVGEVILVLDGEVSHYCGGGTGSDHDEVAEVLGL
jgi:hypothetical protein